MSHQPAGRHQELASEIDPVGYADLSERMRRLLLRRGLSELEAEESIGEAWLTFLSARGRFEGRSRLSTYLLGIAINHGRELRRRESRQRGGARGARAAVRRDEIELASPEAVACGRQLLDWLLEVVDDLPLLQRQAYWAVEIQGHDPLAVATDLGISLGHMRVLVCRARRRLELGVRARTHR